MIKLFNSDCMTAMKDMADSQFDLAIVDPPYFSGPEKRKFYGKNESITKRVEYTPLLDSWKVPTEDYFNELVRVSKNQIIWGCNYYDFGCCLSGRIVWDKCNQSTDFSDCELAASSLFDSVRLFRFMWNGMLQGKSIQDGHIMQGNKKLNEKRIHPTQKPVALYKWLLMNYAKEGDCILDTHLGSGSIAIACHDLGYDFTGYEINVDYFNAAKHRYETHAAQAMLF